MRHRHLHALLDTPLDAPSLRRMKMETRTVEDSEGKPKLNLHASILANPTMLAEYRPSQRARSRAPSQRAGTWRCGLPTVGGMRAVSRVEC